MERREQDDSYRHVLKYTWVFGGVQGLKILVTLLRNKLTAKLLGEAGMGLNKRFLNIAEVLNAWTDFGISFYAVRRISELYEEGTEDDMRRFVGVIRTWSIWSALLGAMLCFFLASWLNDYYIPGEPHRLEIMLLSLFVAAVPIEAVECAILKGLRRLRTVAVVEIISALSTFLFTVPLYYWLGMRGIVLSLVMCGWSVSLIHLFFSVRIYRYRVRLFSHSVVREGWPLIRIGIPYVLAGVAGAMAAG
ncbi:MAG: oligosaccharide flippase family protein, partial [Bacteroidaceae bacterium]|nr:oligosaccharide flippase family protein [Bacteroidaceae bacterium]